jgi:hypothetical protein
VWIENGGDLSPLSLSHISEEKESGVVHLHLHLYCAAGAVMKREKTEITVLFVHIHNGVANKDLNKIPIRRVCDVKKQLQR